MVRFAIRNHRWKAEKLYFLAKLSRFVYPWFCPSGVLVYVGMYIWVELMCLWCCDQIAKSSSCLDRKTICNKGKFQTIMSRNFRQSSYPFIANPLEIITSNDCVTKWLLSCLSRCLSLRYIYNAGVNHLRFTRKLIPTSIYFLKNHRRRKLEKIRGAKCVIWGPPRPLACHG